MKTGIQFVQESIQTEREQLYYFNAALLPEQQRALELLFGYTGQMGAAMTRLAHLPDSEALLLAMLVGLAGDLLQVQARLEVLEKRVRSLQEAAHEEK